MSLNREIKIRVACNYSMFSDLFIDFAQNYWIDSNKLNLHSLNENDIEDFEFKEFNNFDSLKTVLDIRQKNNLTNFINLFVKKFDESILISAISKNETYTGYSSHFEITFNLGIGKRIQNANRYTDFGFYLNQIIPRFLEIGCYVCEVNCQDFDC